MRPPNRRGAIAAMSAVLAVAVIGFAGLAVDLTRIWMVNARLKTAIDAAALVAARQLALPEADRNAQVQAIYWANLSQNGLNAEYLGATVQDAEIELIGTNRVRVTGRASVPTTLFSIINRSDTPIVDSAVAERQGAGLELALVLDVTGSMETAPSVGAERNIAVLRQAATNLVNTLYNGEERRPNLWVSVAPYAAVVNIGRDRQDWLQAGSLNTANYLPTIWHGCVEARVGSNYGGGAYDETETSPSAMPFRPYFVPSNRYDYSRDPNDATKVIVRRGSSIVSVPFPPLATDIPVNRGDNPWIPGAGGTVVANSSTMVPFSSAVWELDPADPGTDDQDVLRRDLGRGPNLGCPRAVLPLTRDRTPILEQIAALRLAHRGGTMAHLGLQLGWGTLSPQWRADWRLTEQREGQTLPLDYNTRAMTKALVLMTDGENQWADVPEGAPGRCWTSGVALADTGFVACVTSNPGFATLPSSAGHTWRQATSGSRQVITNDDRDVSAYGRLSERRLGPAITTNDLANDELNARMSRMCAAMRARGIVIYTVVFQAAPTTEIQDLYRGCASAPENFFVSTTQADLLAAFQNIAGQLASLRLVE
ncbi:pilus assembly protein TadG-related protein [Neoroseomonas rubea]|uniref:pilus assembly protein TadG-related protein n=1 Tax=Neoroseomonas rubea TaxID=2748666 RepID=UPI0018DF3A7B|nr:pilus assembly protein TadG-related protein [Roseomonas rubea]